MEIGKVAILITLRGPKIRNTGYRHGVGVVAKNIPGVKINSKEHSISIRAIKSRFYAAFLGESV